MSEKTSLSRRTERELLEATRPFAAESRIKSWWCVSTTLIALGAVLVSAAVVPWWPLRLGASILGGLLFVRMFILFHDFLHGAILRGSKPAAVLFRLYGLLVLTPPGHWRRSHNFHHANVGKPIESDKAEFAHLTSDVGSFPLMTTDNWQRASGWQRLRYRISRHPLTILGAYLTVFAGSLCVVPLFRNPRKNWEGLLSLVAHGGVIALVWVYAGLPTLFFAFLLPFAIAAALGAYLFFAQHNFTGMRIVPIEEWTHYRGALESSSYLKLGPVMRWFTGSIGYHHVHHLNALIPFYRLADAMASIPELQHPAVTSLWPRDVLACLRLNLWNRERQQLVSYRQATTS
jgi:omega-6 fatty acid desaturase (delta-12 desaturase)